jgi:RyR domain
MNNEQIAKVAHEINAAFCRAFEDFSQPAWEDAPQWQKDSAVDGVEFHIRNPLADPYDSHENWLAEKRAAGWSYGEVKDTAKKEHPSMIPFKDLSPKEKAKDYLFRQVVHSLT